MARVNCQVDSCAYHGKGDLCEADSIMVKNNRDYGLDMEIGTMAGEGEAATSTGTMCETFKPHPRKEKKS